jgi:hypothetical protein
MSDFSRLPVSLQTFSASLNKAGLQSVFDICALSRTAFVRSLPDISAKDARKIYRDARQRADGLKSLYRAWQLRHEPVLSKLNKLVPAPSEAVLDALQRNIGGDGDFSELMKRSSEYADAASVQSLFSPARYAAALYRVAGTLHDPSSPLHIDNRRPDLKHLILSEDTMNQECSSLDILLDVLQKDDVSGLNGLKQTYFPMTLPYDDDLAQINTALDAQGRSLNGIQSVLADSHKQAFYPQNAPVSRTLSAPDVPVEGREFYLMANGKMLYLMNKVAGAARNGCHVSLGKPDMSAIVVAPFRFIWLNGQIWLGENTRNHPDGAFVMKGAYLRGDAGENNGNTGRFLSLTEYNDRDDIKPNYHWPLTLEFTGSGGQVRLLTQDGYVGINNKDDWGWKKTALIVTAEKDNALVFTLSRDPAGKDIISNPASMLPNTTPTPQTRTTLSLTPASWTLMTKPSFSTDELNVHYGIQTKIRNAASLADTLNNVTTFGQKTGLSFNQVLALTAQGDWSDSAPALNSASYYWRFDKNGAVQVTPREYGAAFLNGMSGADTDVLWVSPGENDEPILNLTEETVSPLAGNAEKLVRLHNTTELSFAELDWLIVNACRGANYGTECVIDRTVLNVLAACVTLKQRYGLSTDTFVSFIGAVNPYAPARENSHYQQLFTAPDGLRTQMPGVPMKDVSTDILCAAAGVTEDELHRIKDYCGVADTEQLDSRLAGRICRFGGIARMLGMTFSQAEALWLLMDGGHDQSLRMLGEDTGMAAVTLIHRTEQVMVWMADNNLNLVQVQAMVSRDFSSTATAEMLSYLQNIFHCVGDTDLPSPRLEAEQQQKVLRVMAGGFGIKTGVMNQLTCWLETLHGEFSLAAFLASVQQLFTSGTSADVDTLQAHPDLVENMQRLSQLVLVAGWLGVNEQDLTLLNDNPEYLDVSFTLAPRPDLPLLLLLTRFKRWQTQVTTTTEEALRLLPYLTHPDATAESVAEKVATLHNLPAETVAAMNASLFASSDYAWPVNFSQLWTLLNWLKTGQSLHTGTQTLQDLLTMMQEDEKAEDDALLKQVARHLSTGIRHR